MGCYIEGWVVDVNVWCYFIVVVGEDFFWFVFFYGYFFFVF